MSTTDFNAHAGLDIVGFRDGKFVIELLIGPQHYNRYGYVHGGVLFTMLDTALARAFFDTLPPDGNAGVTLEMKINYLKTASEGRLRAYGCLVNTTRRTALVEGHIENEAGELVAKASATMMLTDPREG
jgi:uncharacterized protein (TIGR00369 family)